MLGLQQLAAQAAQLLKQRDLKLATAESCTGGGLSYLLTSLPGCSAWFERGFVTYSNAAKVELLGVSSEILERCGAVSLETAKSMAEGALQRSQAQISLAITGIAGPDGGTVDKPVGTLWLACAFLGSPTNVQPFLFMGSREEIREQAVEEALKLLINTTSSI